MPKTVRVLAALTLASPLLLGGCDRGQPSSSHATKQGKNTPPTVFVVNYPLQFFAEVTGSRVKIETPELDGAHADDFKPTPEQVIQIQDADLILLNGAGFSPWAQTASLPSSRVVVTSEAFKDSWIKDTTHHGHGHGHDHDDHQHGPEGSGAHDQGNWASFTWLNPTFAAMQAQAVGDAMKRLLPGQQTEIDGQTKKLVAGLQGYAKRAAQLKASHLPEMIAAEPHYHYLEEACGLELHDADWHWEEPEPHDGIGSLEKLVEATGAKYFIIPEDAANLSAERSALLRRLGLTPITIYPLVNTPIQSKKYDIPDFMMLMGENIAQLESLLNDQSSG